ncbi:hypothetical protein CSUB01_12172 [Colletotrichum sublineola]|uniref:Uncharacterized protein n=1 Tax=Colletotrichum sublineola TaxID=1173701 RepID=A0A066XUH7_COLSU|nr:hypothetical protein CSUB01_12172 [Colletotrichum sublineola]
MQQLPDTVIRHLGRLHPDINYLLMRINRRFYSVCGTANWPLIADRDHGRSVLWAVASNNLVLLRAAIQANVSVNVPWPPEWKSIDRTDPDTNINHAFYNNCVVDWTPLHLAAAFGRTQHIKDLLQAGANIDALAECCWPCYSEPDTRALTDAAVEYAARTPLHMALCNGQRHSARQLIAAGASLVLGGPDPPGVSQHNAQNWTVFHDLCRYRGRREVQEAVISEIADNHGNLSATHLQLLNTADSNGYTPLAKACRAGHFRYAVRMLQLGANSQLGPPQGTNTRLLHIALQAADELGEEPQSDVIFRLGLQQYDDVDNLPQATADEIGYLGGLRSDLRALPDLIRRLARRAAAAGTLDHRNGDGRTALHLAAMLGSDGDTASRVLDHLLTRQADTTIRDNESLLPIDVAKDQSPENGFNVWSCEPGTVRAPVAPTARDWGEVAEGYQSLYLSTTDAIPEWDPWANNGAPLAHGPASELHILVQQYCRPGRGGWRTSVPFWWAAQEDLPDIPARMTKRERGRRNPLEHSALAVQFANRQQAMATFLYYAVPDWINREWRKLQRAAS